MLVAAIAVVASVVARLFSVVFNGFHGIVRERWREDGRIPKWLQTGLGGLLAGVVMLAFPQVYGIGLEAIRGAAAGTLFANHAVGIIVLLLAGMALAKIVASTCTVASAASEACCSLHCSPAPASVPPWRPQPATSGLVSSRITRRMC